MINEIVVFSNGLIVRNVNPVYFTSDFSFDYYGWCIKSNSIDHRIYYDSSRWNLEAMIKNISHDEIRFNYPPSFMVISNSVKGALLSLIREEKLNQIISLSNF